MRLAARPTLALLLAIVTTFVAGCGSDDESASKKSSGADRAASTESGDATSEDARATVDAQLAIKLENVGGKDFSGIPVPTGIACTRSSPATCRGTLECPAASDESEDAELCAWLAREGVHVLTAKEEDGRQVCTQQYGGPEVATVTGTIGEAKIDATFSREDGCAISRFDEASPLWTGKVPDATVPVDGGGAASGACPALDPDAPVSSDSPPAADSAADGACATPATASPTPGRGTPPPEPEIISDPPEAFEFEE